MEKMKENELLELALEALRKNLPGQAEIKTIKPVRDPRVRADYLLRIVMQGKEIRYYVEVKTNVTKADKLLAMMRKGDLRPSAFAGHQIHKPTTGGRIETERDRIHRYCWKHIYQSASSIHFHQREQARYCQKPLLSNEPSSLQGLK